MMTSSVLVLGATGKTGKHVVSGLVAKGIPHRAASRRPADGQVRFDWNNTTTHDAALAGAHAIYLVPPDFIEDASAIIGPFLEKARSAGVRRVVFLSSLGVTFPGEPTHSGRHRHEELVQISGMAWTILRPSGFFQNLSEGFLRPGIVHQDSVISAVGSGAAAMIDAEDIAAVAVEALTQAGEEA